MPESRYRDIGWVVNQLYASRIYVGLQTVDGGMMVWIVDGTFRNRADHFIRASRGRRVRVIEGTVADAAFWLHRQALSLFSGSDYARQNSSASVVDGMPDGEPHRGPDQA